MTFCRRGILASGRRRHLWAFGAAGDYFGNGGSTASYGTPVLISKSKWLDASDTELNAYAIRSDGTLWASGNNTWGSVGDGTTTARTTFVQVGSATDWESLGVGGMANTYFVALRGGGEMWAWGKGGKVGDGTSTDRTSPVHIESGSTWLSVATGRYHAAAIKSNNTLWIWGSNVVGAFGDGTTGTSRTSPVQLGTDSWQVVACGDSFTLGIKTSGTLWAWGQNTRTILTTFGGMLGDGTTTDRTTPVQIGSSTWSAISAGSTHSLGIKSDGTLWGWGYNNQGQVGDGTTTQRTSPVQIGSSSNWASVSAGNGCSLARKTDGTLWAWGGGLTGSGTTSTPSSSPVEIGSGGWILGTCGSLFAHGIR